MARRLPRSKTLRGDPKLVYYDSGTGRPDEAPLVLVHDATLRSEDWENAFPRLATRYRVVAYDARGHGKSGQAAEYKLEAFAGDLERVLRDLALESAIVIGHGLGAAVAVLSAKREPGLIRAIVLEDPPLAEYGRGWRTAEFKALRAALDRTADPAAFRSAVTRVPLPAPGPRGERTIGEVRGFYAPERLVTSYAPLDPAMVEAMAAPDPTGSAALAAIELPTVPTLILAADARYGSTVSEEDVDRFTKASATVTRFPGLGPRIHGLRPDPFLEAIEPFLRQHRST